MLTQEVSENFSILPRDLSCDILVKNLPEAKLKSSQLIPLAEDIFKQPSIDSNEDL